MNETIREKTDSIELARGMAGKYSWKIKVYCEDLKDPKQSDEVMTKIAALDIDMDKRYGEKQK